MPWQPTHIDPKGGVPPVFGTDCCASAGAATIASRMPRAFVFLGIVIIPAEGASERPRNSIRTGAVRSKTRRAAGRRKAAAHAVGDGGGDATARIGRRELGLLRAVDDHARLEEDGGRSRRMQHDEVVVIVDAVVAVGE